MQDMSDIIPLEQPIKANNKSGHKPSTTPDAIRKEQNRAAQRACRARKDNHVKYLESSLTKLKAQFNNLLFENNKLKEEQEILRSENWYLKGIVLTLQLICYQNHIVIPQHGPYIEEQTMSILAQSIPEPIASYISVNTNNKPPITSSLLGYKYAIKQKSLFVGSTIITKEGVHIISVKPELSEKENTVISDEMYEDSDVYTNKYDLDFVQLSSQKEDEQSSIVPPIHINVEEGDLNSQTACPTTTDKITSPHQPVANYLRTNIAAIQTIRLRLRLQAVCSSDDSIPSLIKPTPLQLAVPHDPRIDLLPTPFMRDRMILFKDLVNLDEFLDYFLKNSVFIGGNPSRATNWRLPAEYYEKYWFLTIDYEFHRVTNNGSRILQRLDQFDLKQQQLKKKELDQYKGLLKYAKNLTWGQVSSLLGINLSKFEKINNNIRTATSNNYSSSGSVKLVSPTITNVDVEDDNNSDVFLQPICLRDGNEFFQQKYTSNSIIEKKKKSLQHGPQRYHPYNDYNNESRNQLGNIDNNNLNKNLNDNSNIDLDAIWDTVCSFLQFD